MTFSGFKINKKEIAIKLNVIVSPETAQKIDNIIEELNLTPSAIIRNLILTGLDLYDGEVIERVIPRFKNSSQYFFTLKPSYIGIINKISYKKKVPRSATFKHLLNLGLKYM